MATGAMEQGSQGRLFGLPPYSVAVKTAVNLAFALTTYDVAVRRGMIELV